jgi:hypothetical protein
MNGVYEGSEPGELYASHQRFFNHVITAMQMPSIQDATRCYAKHYVDVRAAVHDRIVRLMYGAPGKAASR